MSIGPLGTNFSEIRIEIQHFSFMKIHVEMPSAKWRPFCPERAELMKVWIWHTIYDVFPLPLHYCVLKMDRVISRINISIVITSLCTIRPEYFSCIQVITTNFVNLVHPTRLLQRYTPSSCGKAKAVQVVTMKQSSLSAAASCLRHDINMKCAGSTSDRRHFIVVTDCNTVMF